MGSRFIREWPKSLHDAIQGLGAGQKRLSLHGLAGPFSKYLQTQARPTRLTSLFDSEIRRVLSDFDLNMERVSGKRPRWGKMSGVITQNEAVKKFRIDAVTVQRLLDGGQCVIKARKEEFCYLDEEALGKSVIAWREAMGAFEASQVLGVPRHSVASLQTRGLLNLIEDHDAHMLAGELLYCPKSVNRLRERIRATPVCAGPAGVTLGKGLRGHFHPDTWVDAIYAILERDLSLVDEVPVDTPLVKLNVDEKSLRNWLECLPPRTAPAGIAVSNVEAGRLLQMQDVHISRAAQAGLLEVGRLSGKKAGSLSISLSALKLFHQEYILQTEGEELSGLKRGNFGRLMKKVGYHAVLDVRTTTIWRRSEAMALLQSQQLAAYRQYKVTRTGGRPRKWEDFAVTSLQRSSSPTPA